MSPELQISWHYLLGLTVLKLPVVEEEIAAFDPVEILVKTQDDA